MMLHSNINYLWMGKKTKICTLIPHRYLKDYRFWILLFRNGPGWLNTRAPSIRMTKAIRAYKRAKSSHKAKKSYFFFSSNILNAHMRNSLIRKCIFLFCNRKETENRVICNTKNSILSLASSMNYFITHSVR